MESSANRAWSPVYFLDIEGLEPAEQQRVCHILGVPVPKADAVPQRSASEHEEVAEPIASRSNHGSPVEFGLANTNGGQTLVTPDAGVPVPVPAPHHMVPVPVAVVTANPMAAATMATAGMCMVSMPGGIPAMPGVPVPGLPPAHFVHPDFFRNQPPPNLPLNPHVQEFVPRREYVLPGDGGKPVPDMPAQPPQPLHHPIFLGAPVPYVPPPNYPVPNGGMPAGPGVQQDAAAEPGVGTEPPASVPAGQAQACPAEPKDPEVVSLQQSVSDGVSRQADSGAVRNMATASAASVSAVTSVGGSVNNPAGAVRSAEGGEVAAKPSGAGVKPRQAPVSASPSPQTQSAVGSAVSNSSPPNGEPAVAEKSLKVSTTVTVENFTPATGKLPNATNLQDGGVDSVSAPLQPPRTSTDSAATPTQPTSHTVKPQTVSSGASSDAAQPALQSGFPALGVSQTEPNVVLTNGLASTEASGSKESAPDAKPVAGGSDTADSKPESTQPQPVTAPPKMSWANLFKGSNAPSKPPVVIYKEDSEKTTTAAAPAPSQSQVTKPAEVVSVADDTVAKKLGEFMSKVTLTHSSVALQPRGLVNRANWCYVNATLQALVACPPFYHLFKKLADLPFLSRTASSTPILDSLVQFTSEFNKFERQGNTKKGKHTVELLPGASFEPDYIYKMLQLGKASSSFKHGHQEDAEEFLSYVLDGLHDEMLSAIKHATGGENGTSQLNGFAGSPESSSDRNAENSDEGSESEDWQQVGPRNRGAFTRTTVASTSESTPISEMFVGCTRSGIMQAAAKERATLQPFFTLQLDIQEDKVASVREALEHFVSKESIQGYTCSKTGEKVEVVKRTTLEKLPPVLILHLKCFVYDQAGGCQKLLKNIKFDVDLQITKDLLSSTAKARLQPAQRNYKLFAVVFHHGKKATGGHYTTDVFHPGTNGWVHMDDSRILQVQEQEVLNYRPPKMPYLLYYRRRDLTNFTASSWSS